MCVSIMLTLRFDEWSARGKSISGKKPFRFSANRVAGSPAPGGSRIKCLLLSELEAGNSVGEEQRDAALIVKLAGGRKIECGNGDGFGKAVLGDKAKVRIA